MASVFLSYDRHDADHARSVALALEQAGHSVWWDRHIKGGAQYSKEIEDALKRAEAVVVLWSRHSVESAWVRDEAAAGRDSGRLVPVKLDRTDAPMGFRQYQTIDFSRRGKSARDQAMSELLGAIEAPPSHGAKAAPRGASWRGNSWVWAGLAAVAALVSVALLLWQFTASEGNSTSVTVVANDDSAPAHSLATDLLVKLGSLQSTRGGSLQLVEPASASDADFAFKVGQAGGAGEPRANLALVDRAGTLLWSRQFEQPGGNQADLRQQIAYSAGQVLRCATEALAPTHPKLKLPTLKLYLNGCADLYATTDPRTAIPPFEVVTAQAPKFTAAWGKLLIANLEAYKNTGASDRALQNDLRRHVAQARKVNPDLAEIYLVQSWLQAPRPILGWMRYADEALEKNPDNSEILQNHAIGLGHFGRLHDAINNARRATEVDPLSPGARQVLIAFLADSGAYDAAQRELSEAERLWPGASNVLETRFLLEYRYGDPIKARQLLESGKMGRIPSAEQSSFLAARSDPSAANIERAVAQARALYRQENALHQFIQTLAVLGRKDEVIDVLLSADPASTPGIISTFFRAPLAQVRRDVRFMTIAQRFGLVDYWRATDTWPDFCSAPDLPYDCKEEVAKLAGKSG